MSFNTQQYQIKAEPPESALFIQGFESAWHQPWSEPVRQKIIPRLAVVLITSGLIAPVLNPNTEIIQKFESRWHQGWSEPVRVRPRLGPGLNLFNSLPFPVVPSPSNTLEGWYQWFGEPVWPKKGLKSFLQQTLAHPPLKLAAPSIFLVMSVSESRKDTIISGVDVYDTPPTPYVLIMGSNVTVKEIAATKSGAASIEEI